MFVLNEGFVIWGTGIIAENVFNILKEHDVCTQIVFGKRITDSILYFVDSNKDRVGKEFHNLRVNSVEELCKSNYPCVIAISEGNRSGIDIILESAGKEKGRDYWWYEEFLGWLKDSIFIEVDNSEETRERLKVQISDRMCSLALNSYITEQRIREKEFDDTFEDDLERVLLTLNWRYGENISKIPSPIANCLLKKKNKPKNNRRLGIVVRRLRGGGAERVVSQLIPIFLQHGHDIILFTDDISETDYESPKEVVRHVMKSSMLGDLQDRLLEIKKCVKEYEIDIMCYHSGEEHPELYYELALLNRMGVKTLLELHTSFLSRIEYSKSRIEDILFMYKSIDCLVVLSNADRFFWKSLGCNSVFIPNPTLLPENSDESYINKDESEFNIIWVGRLVKKAKNVLDIVPIMKRVVEDVPNATLKLYGSSDDKLVFRELVDTIERESLSRHIEYCGYETNVDSIYRGADVMLVTSSVEGYPCAIAESKARGIPIVMYELPWLEMLKDKKGYVSVEQRDDVAAAKQLVKLANKKHLKQKMSQEALESAREQSSYNVYDDWADIFNGKELKYVEGSEDASLVLKMLLNNIGVKVKTNDM